jgi:predicted transcriptional regulator
MQYQTHFSSIGSIYATLAKVSARPRYAFLVLQLVIEAADAKGRAGPLVREGSNPPLYLRDWLCAQLLPLSERDDRRSALRARVIKTLEDRLTGNAEADEAVIAEAVEEQVLAAGRTNISRAISDLVKAGYLSRHYTGYATNHTNRGGGRHAVYVVEPQILVALVRPAVSALRVPPQIPAQGQLFAM